MTMLASLIALALCLIWLSWTVILWCRHSSPGRPELVLQQSVLVAYASQTGAARALALQLQQTLGGPQKASLMALSELAPRQLMQVQKAVFVVSTYGDGEPPDNGRRFYRDLQALHVPGGDGLLALLAFEVVALGDRSYPKFCQFGDDLSRQLTRLGANATAPLKKLDRNQPGDSSYLSLAKPILQQWRLMARERLNTQTDAGLFHLRFSTDQPLPNWRAGDVAAIYPNNDLTATPRRYSIASVPEDGEMSLIVRQHKADNGGLGLCSGWLTQLTELDSAIRLQIIDNASCHIDAIGAPLLLIGAGSGLAGIRGHLAQHAHQPQAGSVWLIYGERAAEPSQRLHGELAFWQQRGVLNKLDCAFSRDSKKPAYVQDIMLEKAAEIAGFIGARGHVYVCGRYEGMGTVVDTILRAALGDEGYQQLVEQGRYHRDLY